MLHGRMKKIIWGFLALAELLLAFLLARPAIFNMLLIAFTRRAILAPNLWYFAGMLFGDLIRGLIACLLIYHAVRIVRRVLTEHLA